MPKSKRLKAGVEYGNAQADEAQARGSNYPDNIHEDATAAREAKQRAVKAADEIFALDEETRLGGEKELVTLLSPNDRVSVTDTNGIRFVNGKAENVDKALATRYVQDLEGYEIQGSSKESK